MSPGWWRRSCGDLPWNLSSGVSGDAAPKKSHLSNSSPSFSREPEGCPRAVPISGSCVLMCSQTSVLVVFAFGSESFWLIAFEDSKLFASCENSCLWTDFSLKYTASYFFTSEGEALGFLHPWVTLSDCECSLRCSHRQSHWSQRATVLLLDCIQSSDVCL